MSDRTNLPPQVVIDAVSMGASITSSATVLHKMTCLSYEAIWSGGATPVGVLNFQVSDSFALNPAGGTLSAGTWTTVPVGGPTGRVTDMPVSGNSGSIFLNVRIQAGWAVRLVYTYTSGTGTMTARIAGKVA